MSGFAGIILSFNRLKPDMISPVVVTVGETDYNIVSICVVCRTQNVFIKRCNDALHSTGARTGRVRFQFGPNHHDEADRLTTVGSSDLVVRGPFGTDVLTIIGLHHEIVVSTTADGFALDRLPGHGRMLGLVAVPGNQSVQVRSVTRVVRVVIGSISCIPVQVEFEVVLNPVIVKVQHRVAFRCNRHFLTFAGFRQAESDVMAGIAETRTCGIILITVVHGPIRDISANPAVLNYFGILHVITGSIHILCPEDDRIGSFRVGNPLRIDGNIIVQLIAKLKLITVGAFLVRIPSAKGVSKADHILVVNRFSRYFPGFSELRGIIGAALPIFIKDQPVAFRRFHGEGHITMDSDLFVVRVYLALCITVNVRSTIMDFPTQEGVGVIR